MMRRKNLLLALVPVVLLASSAATYAQPSPVRWEGEVGPQATRIVLQNLSARPAEVRLGSGALTLPAYEITEIPAARLGAGRRSLRSAAHLLVLEAPDGFDAESLAIERSVGAALDPVSPSHPGWARELVEGGAAVRSGSTGSLRLVSDDPAARVEVAIELPSPHSSVRLRQLDAAGNELAFLVASASRPVRFRVRLGAVGGESRIELRTLRGEARGTAAAVLLGDRSRPRRLRIGSLNKVGGGTAVYSAEFNWELTGALTYSVNGAPANVCGDLHISRNFAPYTVTPGWICTDSSGNATKGPWSYANQSGDEESYAYIVWPDGSATHPLHHIWDKSAPTASVASFSSTPPTSLTGSANDPGYGAGFSSSWGTHCSTYFLDTTSTRYWSPTSGYTNVSPWNGPCAISGMPSRSATWAATQIPPASAHASTHCFEWGVFFFEASPTRSSKYGPASRSFCVP
jgi:hypothetical protein